MILFHLLCFYLLKSHLSSNYGVYTQTSKPVDEYFIAYIKGWDISNTDELKTVLINRLGIDTSKVNCEVVLMEKFLNSDMKQYSKIYVKLTLSNENKLRIIKFNNKRQSSTVSRARLLVPETQHDDHSNKTINDVLLFKLRTIYFKKALPIHNQSIVNIIERSWMTKLDRKQFVSQNGLRLLVNIIDYKHYLTNKNEKVFGFSYIISINGQDPEFIGITEPTFADYIRETEKEKLDSIEFCSYNANEVDLFYVSVKDNEASSLELKLNKVLKIAWTQLNEASNSSSVVTAARSIKSTNRIVNKLRLNNGYFDINRKNVYRLAVSWLVDGSTPNPLYFTRPTFDDLIPLLSDYDIKPYNDLPLINITIPNLKLAESSQSQLQNISLSDLFEAAILNAWLESNANLKPDIFHIYIENSENDESSTSRNIKNRNLSKRDLSSMKSFDMNMLVGVNDKTFDVTDLNRPSEEVFKRHLKRSIPNIQFGSVDSNQKDGLDKSGVNMAANVSFGYIFDFKI